VIQRAASLTLYARQLLERSAAEDAVQEALVALLSLRHLPDDPDTLSASRGDDVLKYTITIRK
jgi:DNA-directed RNA polymerase specialized sigma24 family protein